MACLESLHNHQDFLYKTIGSIYKLYESMPDGEHRNRLLDEISKLDVITNGIRDTLDMMEE
jgi:hypothetical protein